MTEPLTPKPIRPVTVGAAEYGTSFAAGLFALDPDVLFWALWGVLAVGGTMGVFTWKELRTYLGPGRTLSEVTEASIAARPLLWWTLLAAMSTLAIGWPLLIVHWYTSLL
jgi:hypothetical protein